MPAGHFGTFTWIALALMTGACGKSAQLPLYVWLPDAMEGPTPVSALIHAATMVTAGVYVVARSHIIFLHSPIAMAVVGVIGCVTALFAATIALVQTDIKKVLAYSTVSQLGYMFLACGAGAFSAGIFHLMTHAFFKALLFLAAGSVIHAMGGEQDMRKMGGLRKQIPWTYWTMLIATFAIVGVPGFSGFFSKDAILSATFLSPYGGKVLWGLGAFTVLLTAFYMFRLIFLTFFGNAEYDQHKVHVHESPANMLVPLVILAVLSVIGGWQAAPALWGGENHFDHYLAPVFADAASAMEPSTSAMNAHSIEQQLTLVAFLLAALGFFIAWWLCIKNPKLRDALAETFSAPYRLLVRKYYVDELYAGAIVRPLVWSSNQRVMAWPRRRLDRRHGKRRGPSHQRNRRPGAPRGIGQHAKLRFMDCGRCRCFHFPAALAGGALSERKSFAHGADLPADGRRRSALAAARAGSCMDSPPGAHDFAGGTGAFRAAVARI